MDECGWNCSIPFFIFASSSSAFIPRSHHHFLHCPLEYMSVTSTTSVIKVSVERAVCPSGPQGVGYFTKAAPQYVRNEG